ncbi:conserved protein of unknown function [Rhodovastum atsumiense]|nr:conserved protein of unknown function [Rhodovastum atsumiense]
MEGTISGKSQGAGASLSFQIDQVTPVYKSFYWEVQPVTGSTQDFWSDFFSNVVGGEPADQFALSGFGTTASVVLNADSLKESDETFRISFYRSALDPHNGVAPEISATFTVIDDDSKYVIPVIRGGQQSYEEPTKYSGPVSYLQYQFLGSASAEVVAGGDANDFFNLLGGDDAANGGGGNDVLDGGTGSNFLTGGAGHDVFFLDGRGGTTTWATITDWEAGEELSIWGWHPGVSKATWVDNAGAAGWTGVTMHGDLDGNGTIDTSVTWAGMTRAQLPSPFEFDGLLWFK